MSNMFSLSHHLQPIVFVILRGGLGNQLHQIAAGASLGQGKHIKIRIFPHIVDSSINSSRKGYFRHLNLADTFPNTNLRETNKLENLLLRASLKWSLPYFRNRTIDESNFHSKEVSTGILFVRGWFQSHEFLPKHFVPTNLVSLPPQLNNTINFHIRLTDFAEIDKNPLGAEYYRKAFLASSFFRKKLKTQVFSDDISESRRLIDFISSPTFPESEELLDPHELLKSLSDCSVLICSRSSLCWWAAQVVQSRGGKVFSPWVGLTHNASWEQIIT